MKVLQYFPEEDMLYVTLADVPSVDQEEVSPGVLLEYDQDGNLIGIEVDQASRIVNLKDIKKAPDFQVDWDTAYLTVTEAAERLGIESQTLRLTIRSMREEAIEIGQQKGPTYPILLSIREVKKIKQWREEHPPGRPTEKAPEVEQV